MYREQKLITLPERESCEIYLKTKMTSGWYAYSTHSSESIFVALRYHEYHIAFIPIFICNLHVLHNRGSCSTCKEQLQEFYAAVLGAIFQTSNEDNKLKIKESLKGIIFDWESPQAVALHSVLGEERAPQL